MANFKELRIVSSIPGQTMNEYCLTSSVPALRLEGKWLEDYTMRFDLFLIVLRLYAAGYLNLSPA